MILICHVLSLRYDEVWNPGQDVKIDHAAIVEILLLQLDNRRELAYNSFGDSRDSDIKSAKTMKYSNRLPYNGWLNSLVFLKI